MALRSTKGQAGFWYAKCLSACSVLCAIQRARPKIPHERSRRTGRQMAQHKQSARQRRYKRRGVLTLEWILLVTVLVIGIIGGLGAVRNATVGELQDLAEAIEALNVKTDAEIAAENP